MKEVFVAIKILLDDSQKHIEKGRKHPTSTHKKMEEEDENLSW